MSLSGIIPTRKGITTTYDITAHFKNTTDYPSIILNGTEFPVHNIALQVSQVESTLNLDFMSMSETASSDLLRCMHIGLSDHKTASDAVLKIDVKGDAVGHSFDSGRFFCYTDASLIGNAILLIHGEVALEFPVSGESKDTRESITPNEAVNYLKKENAPFDRAMSLLMFNCLHEIWGNEFWIKYPSSGYTGTIADKYDSRIGKAVVPLLVESLKNPEVNVRIHAINLLGRIGPNASDAIPSLISVLRDDEYKYAVIYSSDTDKNTYVHGLAHDALVKIAGTDYGLNANDWISHFTAH